jgi:hypothetical protein
MKIGNDFKTEIPDFDIEKCMSIGGYKAIIKTNGEVLIQGIGLFSVNKALIGNISIMPLDEEAQLELSDFPFEIEKHRLIFQVSFNGFAWYFKNKKDAFILMDLMLQVKEVALHNKFINNIKFEEDKK